MMKRMIAAMLSLVLLLSFAACKKEVYADNIKATDLADHAVTALNDGVTYLPADSGYLDDYFTAPDYVTESVIYFASDTNNLNELGIYRVSEGNAEKMETVLKDYLKSSLEKNQSWYDSYIPEETPKLRDAEVKVFGNYVVYAIFDAKDRTTVFDSIKGKLTAED